MRVPMRDTGTERRGCGVCLYLHVNQRWEESRGLDTAKTGRFSHPKNLQFEDQIGIFPSSFR